MDPGVDGGLWGVGRVAGPCPPPEVRVERAEWRLPCASARKVGLCQRKEELGLEQLELQEINLSFLWLVGEAGTGPGVLASVPRTRPAGVGISSGPVPVPAPRAPRQGLGCVSLPVSPSVLLTGEIFLSGD